MSINPNLPVYGPMTKAEWMIAEDQSTANLQASASAYASAGELKVNGLQTKAVAVASGNYKIPMGEQFTAAMSKAGKIALAVIKAVGYILATVLTGGLALISKNFRNHASDAIFGTNKVAYSKYVEAEKGTDADKKNLGERSKKSRRMESKFEALAESYNSHPERAKGVAKAIAQHKAEREGNAFDKAAFDAGFKASKVAPFEVSPKALKKAKNGLNKVDQPVERDPLQDYVGQKAMEKAVNAHILKTDVAPTLLATIGKKQAEAKAEAEKAKAEAEEARRREEEPTIMEQVEDHPVVAAGVTATVFLLGLAALAKFK